MAADFETCRSWASNNVWLFNKTLGMIGQIDEFYDGVDKVYVSSVNSKPVTEPVIKFKSGDAFLFNKSILYALNNSDMGLYRFMTDALRDLVSNLAHMASTRKVPIGMFFDMLILVLRAQTNKIQEPRNHEP